MAGNEGRFVWYELMTSDPKAAEKFYSDVVGWKARDAGMPAMTYTLMSAGAADIAGVMAIPDEAKKMGARPGWIGYVGVADVDKAAERLQKAGGNVHRAPDDIPGVGRFAVVADPGGAAFALFKGSSPPPTGSGPAAGAIGTVGWHELMAADWQTAWTFYSQLFGWDKGEAMDMGPAGKYQLFNIGEEMIGGMMTKPAEVPQPFWAYYFTVEALDAAQKRAEKGGGKVVMGPMEVPGGSWVLAGIDPQGAHFALLARKR
jgi:predicted enzyme related to lactoylglutathione lyase